MAQEQVPVSEPLSSGIEIPMILPWIGGFSLRGSRRFCPRHPEVFVALPGRILTSKFEGLPTFGIPGVGHPQAWCRTEQSLFLGKEQSHWTAFSMGTAAPELHHHGVKIPVVSDGFSPCFLPCRMEQNECECPCECPLEVNECTGNLTNAESR